MKKICLFLLAPLLLIGSRSDAQAGRNCFNTQFHNEAANFDENDAALLGYLCTMSYAQYLRYLISTPAPPESDPAVQKLFRHDDQFLDVYRGLLTPFFTSATFNLAGGGAALSSPVNSGNILKPGALGTITPGEPAVTFQFHSECDPNGYDPEAILISTPSTIYVVFRGTDRVACNTNPFGYQWAEWMASDFKFLKRDASVMNSRIPGQVHRGMVESLLLRNFADSLAASIASLLKNKSTGAAKKVWITGHSLGGAHAQLFAMFLKYNYNITAQGVYLYESPHPGDQTFVNQLNADIGKTHIQRFEFGDDPIPDLPPQALFFARAGVRNYFKDYNSPKQTSEQIPGVDDLKILCVLGNLPGEQLPQTARLQFPPICPGSTCFHHPTFILQAIRHQMNTSVLSSFPAAVPLPAAGDNCNLGDLTKAENNDLINNTATAVENTIATVAWQAGNILDNLIGSGLTEGNYKISCYGFQNNSKKYLTWNGNTNSTLSIGTSGSVFTVSHKGTGGYQLWISGANMASDVTFNLVGAPTGTEHTSNIIMKSRDIIIGDEETWYFFKVPNKVNTYAILNWNTQKLLDANDNCLSSNACNVGEASGKSNDATQVWILEHVN